MDRGYFYTTEVDPEATRVELNIESPTPGKATVVDVLAGVSSGVLSSEASAKLNRAVNPAGIAASVSMGFEKVIAMYFKARPVPAVSDHPAFIVNTRLKECSLRSASGGIELCLKTQVEITDAATGKMAWRNCEESYFPIKSTPAGTVPIPVLGTAISIYNATEFFKLSDKEIQDVILEGAEDSGTSHGKRLRRDYAR